VTLLLVMIFACLMVGLFASRFGGRQQILVGGLATVMTALYFFFAARFM
jgi:MFS-type transporter involved in bile tolerance (Atg22 family)